MKNQENLLGILETFFRWKKPILSLCVLAGIGAILISLLLPNYYKASTVYYVASPDQALPDPVGSRLKEKTLYGTDADVDRNLSIAQSNELVDFIVDSFNLYEHYDIDPKQEKAASKVRKKFRKLYEIKRTKYDAVELSIEDTDKELTKTMTIAARQKIASISTQLIKESLQKNIQSISTNVQNKERDLQTLGDSLLSLRQRYGVYNAESQTEFLATELASTESKLALNKTKLSVLEKTPGIRKDTIRFITALVAGLEQKAETTKQNIEAINKGLPKIASIERSYQDGVRQLSLDKQRLKQSQAAYEAKPPVLFLVEEAQVPVEKSRPKRSILCISAVLIAFILGLMGALLFDMYKDVDWKKIVHAR